MTNGVNCKLSPHPEADVTTSSLPSTTQMITMMKHWQKSSLFSGFFWLLISKYNKIIPMGDNSSYMLPWLPTILLSLYNDWRWVWSLADSCISEDPDFIISPDTKFSQHQHPGIFANSDNWGIFVKQITVIFAEKYLITFNDSITFIWWWRLPRDFDAILTDWLAGYSLRGSTGYFLRVEEKYG